MSREKKADKEYVAYIMRAIFGEDKKDKIVFSNDIPKLINELLNRLNEKQRLTIDKCANGMNMSEIARYYGASPSTIRYQKIKAIRRMRNPTWCKPLFAFIKRD